MVNHAYRLQEIANHLVIHHTKLTKALRNAGKTDISRPDPIFLSLGSTANPSNRNKKNSAAKSGLKDETLLSLDLSEAESMLKKDMTSTTAITSLERFWQRVFGLHKSDVKRAPQQQEVNKETASLCHVPVSRCFLLTINLIDKCKH